MSQLSPLGHLNGARPEAPAWFTRALDQAPERSRLEVEGAGIETLAWGRRGAPGLLLIHGAGAHADWWSFLAPILAEDYRVAAFSMSGMGGSDHRQRYAIDLYASEAFAVAEAAGLFEAAEKPVIAAHSFGGRAVLRVASGPRAEEFKAALTLDTLIRPPGLVVGGRPFGEENVRVYPSLEATLARFRLVPPQPSDNLYILDHMARGSIKRTVSPEGAEGWGWRFDPMLWSKLEEGRPSVEDIKAVRIPLGMVIGERSRLMVPEVRAYIRENIPQGSPVVVLPEAHHHLMLDQPLALVAALRGLLAGWPR